MTDTTTIQVRKDQAEQLKEIARKNGNYKTAIDRVLEDYNTTTTEVVDKETVHNLRDELLAAVSAECGDTATQEHIGELSDTLRTIEERTGRLERQLERLG